MTDINSQDGKVVKFGIGQLQNPTPLFVKYTFRCILFISALWALLSTQFGLPADVMAMINKWLLIGNSTINLAIQFFGLDFENK